MPPANGQGLTYEKVVDYHYALRKGDPPVIKPDGKSKCAADLDVAKAQALLDHGYRVGTRGGWPSKVYACHGGTWYQAHQHGPGCYHGYPVRPQRVPKTVRKRWKADMKTKGQP